ncbi:MAG: hypothetical protein EA343_11350 [Nodularia sp. (in: Bacteria)]|nr:MAG: hypothetical protein EA343_11350 [Nodularia sp. (in: cyanobacteria)]
MREIVYHLYLLILTTLILYLIFFLDNLTTNVISGIWGVILGKMCFFDFFGKDKIIRLNQVQIFGYEN